MKRSGAFIVLGLAILLGIGAVYLTNRWLATQTQNTKVQVVKESIPMAQVVVAAKDISVGSRLGEDNLTLTDWPEDKIPKGAFTNMETLKDRIAVSKLVPGEPLLAAELAAPDSGAGLVAMIEKGHRAMSVKVNEEIGVGGFILPNTYVDIIGVEKINNQQQKVETILQRVKVLAIAQETFTEEGKAKIVRTVTLELEPEQAEVLALQTHKGSIHFSLRNPAEKEETAQQPQPEPKTIAKAPVVRKKSVPTLQAKIYTPKPQPFDVEVIRAGDRQKITFANAAIE